MTPIYNSAGCFRTVKHHCGLKTQDRLRQHGFHRFRTNFRQLKKGTLAKPIASLQNWKIKVTDDTQDDRRGELAAQNNGIEAHSDGNLDVEKFNVDVARCSPLGCKSQNICISCTSESFRGE